MIRLIITNDGEFVDVFEYYNTITITITAQ